MNLQLTYLLGTTAVSLFVLAFLLRHPRIRGSRHLIGVCLVSMIWITGEVYSVLSIRGDGQFVGEIIRNVGAVSIPVAILLFVCDYCGRPLALRWRTLISLVPIVSIIMLVTTSYHGLFFKSFRTGLGGGPLDVEYGSYFLYVHVAYSYALIVGSLGLLLFEINRVSQRFRTQLIILFGSICIPIGINVLNLSAPIPEINLNPLGFIAFLGFAAVGISRFHMFRGSPIAYETVFKTAQEGVIVLNNDGVVMDINPAAANGLSRPRAELIGSDVDTVFGNWEPFSSRYKGGIEEHDEIELSTDGEQRFYALTKTPVCDEQGAPSGRILSISDVTSQRLHEQNLEAMAFLDPLTMLANRRKFEEEFDYAAKLSGERDRKFAVLFFDLDSFKLVNDMHGHRIGDELLKYVAARIASILRKPDIVARLGGDEFAAILHNATEPGVKIAVERIVENTAAPFRIKGTTISVDLSIGAAFYPDDGQEIKKLLNRADSAMYRAKSSGGGLVVYDNAFDRSGHSGSRMH